MYPRKYGKWSSHQTILRLLPAGVVSMHLLDVGCGDGYISSEAAKRGFKVTAVDKRAIGEDIPGVTYVWCDLDAPAPNHYLDGEPIDYIVCADVLEHLVHMEQTLFILNKFAYRLIISVPNMGNWYARLNVLFGRFPHVLHGLFDRTHRHFYTIPGWRQVLAENDVEVLKEYYTVVPFELVGLSWLERVNHWLNKVWPKMFAWQVVFVCKGAK